MTRLSLDQAYNNRDVIAKLKWMENHIDEQDSDIADAVGNANNAVTKVNDISAIVETIYDQTEEASEKADNAMAKAVEVESKLGTVYKIKGSITNAGLTALTSQETGDVWNITDNGTFPKGSNVVWTGTEWDKLSETMDLSPITDAINRIDAEIGDVDTPNTIAGDLEANKHDIVTIAETYQVKPTITQVTLTSVGWTTEKTQQVSLINSPNDVIIVDAADGYKDDVVNAMVYVNSRTNTALVFKCNKYPTRDLVIDVVEFPE